MGLIDRSGRVSRFLSVTGGEHQGSELTGVAFDPSGRRLYFASQRARKTGAVYEVSGPFRGGSAGVTSGTSAGAASPSAAPACDSGSKR